MIKLTNWFWIALFNAVIPLIGSTEMTPVAQYRMGENDPGAVSGGLATNSLDSAGTNYLTFNFAPVYSSDTPAGQGSTLSLNFFGTNYSVNPRLNLRTSFIAETWVKPTTLSGVHAVFYNGQGGGNGWGLLQDGANFKVLLGGVQFLGSSPVTLNTWTHLALVVSDSNATFMVNGVTNATALVTPKAPIGFFTVGAGSELGHDTFVGGIDEVRVSQEAKTLTVRVVGANQVELSWPAVHSADTVQYSTNLLATNWGVLTNLPVIVGGVCRITNSFAEGERFYRLCDGEKLPPLPVLTFRQGGGPIYDIQNQPVLGPGCTIEFDNRPNCAISRQTTALSPVFFDASQSVDRVGCEPKSLSFNWEIYKSMFYGDELYTHPAITNNAPVLVIPQSALPDQPQTDDDPDATYWRVRLTIRHEPFLPPYYETIIWFRFEYLFSDLSL